MKLDCPQKCNRQNSNSDYSDNVIGSNYFRVVVYLVFTMKYVGNNEFVVLVTAFWEHLLQFDPLIEQGKFVLFINIKQDVCCGFQWFLLCHLKSVLFSFFFDSRPDHFIACCKCWWSRQRSITLPIRWQRKLKLH